MNTQKKLTYNTVCDFFEGKNDISDLLNILIPFHFEVITILV